MKWTSTGIGELNLTSAFGIQNNDQLVLDPTKPRERSTSTKHLICFTYTQLV